MKEEALVRVAVELLLLGSSFLRDHWLSVGVFGGSCSSRITCFLAQSVCSIDLALLALLLVRGFTATEVT